jgi:hypothetical protein
MPVEFIQISSHMHDYYNGNKMLLQYNPCDMRKRQEIDMLLMFIYILSKFIGNEFDLIRLRELKLLFAHTRPAVVDSLTD